MLEFKFFETLVLCNNISITICSTEVLNQGGFLNDRTKEV